MIGKHVNIRGKRFFVCEYTGAPCQIRYFVPAGKFLRKKEGCFATLPILLRAVFEEEGCSFTKRFKDVKTVLLKYYNQPDIPLQPTLSIERVPLSDGELFEYLNELDMGMAWLKVDGGQLIDNVLPKRQELPIIQLETKKEKKRKIEHKDEDSDEFIPPLLKMPKLPLESFPSFSDLFDVESP